ncbi:uncharacterized protein LOC133782791 [Humulus lupulus]|uniref:uncharacterized protein LOC133782791 n=1 Tax=Humulus lupulus TaxID=3486 RepID=UPI002B403B0A|nr:uncharacterized protein LOC133782791 [Humulus lupulus]
MSEGKSRRVTLYCPSLSKLLPMAVCVDQRIDLGYIATAFGLDPSTLRINGHFIGRGLDLISSYLTWNSLLSFFSAKRLSTGKHCADALIVHGKLCRVGTKRAHDPQDDAVNGIGNGGRPELEDTVLTNANKKMREANSGKYGDFCGMPMLSKGLGFKRKQLLEDLNLLKKLRINETYTDQIYQKRVMTSPKAFQSTVLDAVP